MCFFWRFQPHYCPPSPPSSPHNQQPSQVRFTASEVIFLSPPLAHLIHHAADESVVPSFTLLGLLSPQPSRPLTSWPCGLPIHPIPSLCRHQCFHFSFSYTQIIPPPPFDRRSLHHSPSSPTSPNLVSSFLLSLCHFFLFSLLQRFLDE